MRPALSYPPPSLPLRGKEKTLSSPSLAHEGEVNDSVHAHGDAPPRRYIMCWSFMFSTGNRSTDIRTAGVLPVFCHQCDVPFFSGATSPALCTIGTAQLLAYSTISPETT